MSGPAGPRGPTGITGTTGWQGLRGLTGPPIGPTGPPFVNTTGRLTIVTPSSSNIQLTLANLDTYFNITSNATTDGNIYITFPLCNATYPGTNELFPTPEQAGSFWRIRNNYSDFLLLYFSNGTVSYGATSNATQFYLPYGQGALITYDGSNAFIVM
jgi:hypothetical protein